MFTKEEAIELLTNSILEAGVHMAPLRVYSYSNISSKLLNSALNAFAPRLNPEEIWYLYNADPIFPGNSGYILTSTHFIHGLFRNKYQSGQVRLEDIQLILHSGSYLNIGSTRITLGVTFKLQYNNFSINCVSNLEHVNFLNSVIPLLRAYDYVMHDGSPMDISELFGVTLYQTQVAEFDTEDISPMGASVETFVVPGAGLEVSGSSVVPESDLWVPGSVFGVDELLSPVPMVGVEELLSPVPVVGVEGLLSPEVGTSPVTEMVQQTIPSDLIAQGIQRREVEDISKGCLEEFINTGRTQWDNIPHIELVINKLNELLSTSLYFAVLMDSNSIIIQRKA